MASIIQYIKDTRGELRHVAWPTQTQTILYTIIIAALSVFVALYLGLFDFLFTTGLTKVLQSMPSTNPITVTQQPAVQPDITATPTLNTNLGGTPTTK